MKCTKCGNEMREGQEQIGIENGVAVYNTFAYCDSCNTKVNLNALKKKNEPKKHSTLSIWACVLSLFGCTTFISFILALVDLCQNDKQKKHIGSVFALVMCVIYFIVASSIVSGNNKDESGNAEKDNQIVINQNNDNTSKEAPEGDAKQEKGNEVEVGGTFEKDGLKITINNADIEFTDYNDEYSVYAPADGMKYIMVSFTFENTGNSDQYVSIYDFDCYADNTACEQAYLPDESDFINANLSPGRNISFQTYYSVPVDAQSIELEYETNIWTGEKAIIKIQ